MKVYVCEIKDLVTGEKQKSIIDNQTQLLEMITNLSENGKTELTISATVDNFREYYTEKMKVEPIFAKGKSMLRNEQVFDLMLEFGFKVNGKERITRTELLAFCNYLEEIHNIKPNWTTIKKQLEETGNLVTVRSGGLSYYKINL